jgi:hypothetical protein
MDATPTRKGAKGMKARVLGGTVVIAIAGLGAFAAIGLGEQGDQSVSQVLDRGHATPKRAVHEVARPSGNVGVAAAKGKKPTIRYFESDPITVPGMQPGGEPAEQGGTLSCPKKTKVLSGYFGTGAPGVALSFSALGATTRRWDMAAFNTTATENTVVFGVVCAKSVK